MIQLSSSCANRSWLLRTFPLLDSVPGSYSFLFHAFHYNSGKDVIMDSYQDYPL